MLEGIVGKLMVIFILCGIVEILVEFVKEILGKVKEIPKRVKLYIAIVVSFIVGIIYALQTEMSLLSLLGYNVKWPIVDIIMTGFFLAEGSKFIHKIMDFIGTLKDTVSSKVE